MRWGRWGWLSLAGVVVAVDLAAIRTDGETMSSAFYEALRHPIRRWPVIAAWAYLTGHLFRLWPVRLDPLRVVGDTIRNRSGG